MCGFIVKISQEKGGLDIRLALESLAHRGPDARKIFSSPTGCCVMGHNRLSVIDLSCEGTQPMQDPSSRYSLVLNGEIYNYLELRAELSNYWTFRSKTDSEVLLAAYVKWGAGCLNYLIGMFSFAIWDEAEQSLFAARDRFGVKPFYYAVNSQGALLVASEIKALHAMGIKKEMDPVTWSTYLAFGFYDHSERTFWKNVSSLPAGHTLSWHKNNHKIEKWYDLKDRISSQIDNRADDEVQDEYLELLKNSLSLRFRSDVPVGINLSGGLDSSLLLGLINATQKEYKSIKIFTFITGEKDYDELPWVKRMLAHIPHSHYPCLLSPQEVPDLAAKIQGYQDEPFGGIPTIAYSKVFELARQIGVIVLLDGQGMDEQWAGYDYYKRALNENGSLESFNYGPVQGSSGGTVFPECLEAEFLKLAERPQWPEPFPDRLRNLQYRDLGYNKIPRALRFNDRISMMYGTELREPFLDHRLVELSFQQPVSRKIRNGTQKWMIRKLARTLLPEEITDSPKRSVQTPQREWLRGALKQWANECLDEVSESFGGNWFKKDILRQGWANFCSGKIDNSFYAWQWVSLALINRNK